MIKIWMLLVFITLSDGRETSIDPSYWTNEKDCEQLGAMLVLSYPEMGRFECVPGMFVATGAPS